MLKLIITAVAGMLLGVLFGTIQSTIQKSTATERFVLSREGMAERREEATRDDIVGLIEDLGDPKLEVEGGTEFDFGSMLHGTQQSHDFWVKNVGTGPLVLEMGESTCKCTVGDLDKPILKPGQRTQVTLTWKAQAITTDFGQSATLLTNDPENTEVKFSVFGKIARSIFAIPSEIELGHFSDQEEVNRTFYIVSYLDGTKELQRLGWSNSNTEEFVELESREISAEEAEGDVPSGAKSIFEVKLKVKPGMPLGPFASRVQFETNHGDSVKTIEIPVNGRISGTVELQGGPSFNSEYNMLTIGDVKSSEGAKVTLLLFIRGEDKDAIIPEIESVTPEDLLKVSMDDVKVTETRNIYRLTFEVPKGSPEAYYPARGKSKGGGVVIQLTGALERELRVIVRFSVSND